MNKKEKKEAIVVQPKETKVVPVIPDQELILQGDPVKQVEFAQKASKALVAVIQSKPKKVMINGKQYIEYEDWQMLARFYGITVGVEWTKPIANKEGVVIGFQARANALRNGEILSSAEARCLRSEKNWKSRDEFTLMSMSQTRASAKALRNILAWVVVMAGYQGTPVEEIGGKANIIDAEKQVKGMEKLMKAVDGASIEELEGYLVKIKKAVKDKKYTKDQGVEFTLAVESRISELKSK